MHPAHSGIASRLIEPYLPDNITAITAKDSQRMNSFADRERAQGAQEAEMAFRIHARRNRLLGQWAAVRMGLSPEEADTYARSVVHADFEEADDEDVVRKLLGDLLRAGVEAEDTEVRNAMHEKEAEARRSLMGPA